MSDGEFDPLFSQARPWQLPVFEGAPNLNISATARPHTTQELDEIEAAAYQDGYARGHAEGFAAGFAEAREQADKLTALLTHLARPLRDIDAEVERALVAMTIEIARRIAHLEIDLDPTRVTAVVREAVSVLGANARGVQVHLHPDDLSLLSHSLSMPGEAKDWKLVADPELARGDCHIVTDGARVDARLDTRQACIAQSLLGDSA